MVLSILVSLITVRAILADTMSTVQESKGACALQTKMKKDGAQFVTCSSEEIMCHDSTTMTDSCHPKSTGCPVTCPAGEHVCHMPPSCDGCDGYNWCSSYTCPVYCGVDEVMCHDSTTMTDTCHPAATGCPVTCPPGDHVCHMPPTCDTCHGYSYCSTHSCPVYCGMDEVMCHDSATMTDSCHPASTGCPITCPPGDQVCHMPPSCEGCEGHSYCSPSACPVYCGVDEVTCHDANTMTDSCHPASTGCPVTCPPGDHLCHMPATCDTCHGYSYCSPSSCPVYCGVDEVMCHDSTTMTDSCHPKSTGCPVTCPPGDNVCHVPPPCDTCDGYSYCSPGSCPVYCGIDEVVCHDSTTMTDSCHP
ncbi:brcc3, partial [Symbiodinium sp. CCMP2456]